MIERHPTRRAARTEPAPRAPAAATWVDPESGLEWQCASPGEMTWPEAVAYAGALKLAGRADWRLPAVAELESLLDRTRYRPVVRAGGALRGHPLLLVVDDLRARPRQRLDRHVRRRLCAELLQNQRLPRPLRARM